MNDTQHVPQSEVDEVSDKDIFVVGTNVPANVVSDDNCCRCPPRCSDLWGSIIKFMDKKRKEQN